LTAPVRKSISETRQEMKEQLTRRRASSKAETGLKKGVGNRGFLSFLSWPSFPLHIQGL
jgi:hypothetical protein